MVSKILNGFVVQTDVESWTGKALYSDFAMGKANKDTPLNRVIKIPVIGIVGGLARVALGIIHTVGHLFLALVTRKKGHLFHAAKGGCEILRGLIEAMPGLGRLFAYKYNPSYASRRLGTRSWWIIKIYNPKKPDGLDQWMDNWKHYPEAHKVYA